MKNKNTNIDLPELISRLENEEIRQKKTIKRVIGMYWGLIILYAPLPILFRHDFFSVHNIGTLIIMMSLVVILLYFKKVYKNLKKIDYSAPTIQMLHEVVARYHSFVSYKYYNINPLPFLIGLLLLQIGVTMMIYTIFGSIEPLLSILYIQLVWFFILACSLGAGILYWHKRYKPLSDNALALIKELEQ